MTDRAYHASRQHAADLLARAQRLRLPEQPVLTAAQSWPAWIRAGVGLD